MLELSQSLSDMPARRAAASARSRTDGSMASTLHDTREFMLSSGSRLRRQLHLQPPRASLQKRQSNSAQVVCLKVRLFRDTVNNQLRNQGLGPESCIAT